MLTLKMTYLPQSDLKNLVGLTALVVVLMWAFYSQDQASGGSLRKPWFGMEKEEAAEKEDEEVGGFQGWWRHQLERKLRVINIPGVVLQTPLSFIDSLTDLLTDPIPPSLQNAFTPKS